MRELGIESEDVIFKTDQEPSIIHLVDEIGRRKAGAGGRWIRENGRLACEQRRRGKRGSKC